MEKALLNVKECCEYLGWGETKVRSILRSEYSPFTVRMGNRLYANKGLLDEYLRKCAKYHIAVGEFE